MVSETLTKSLLTILGFSTGALSLLILRSLKDSGDTSMVKMKLNPDDVVEDFKIIAGGNFLMFIGFLMYIYGVVVSNDMFWIASKLMGVLYGGIFAFVLFRWWRRFR